MGGPAQLVAAGGVRSCDPERIVLKKVVLTGALWLGGGRGEVHSRSCGSCWGWCEDLASADTVHAPKRTHMYTCTHS